ncbi:MAG: hypothetical protein KZQ92_21020 [Candidatus Thiodiazotropha sp. (ex Lucinoma borealis)]|nr:hypothetical protein [Candidatus Thiodiazotropha sp. (ex Lucinoma borealis)]
MYIDFQALKEAVSIEQVAGMLGIDLSETIGQWRGPCPHCKEGGERTLAITPGKGFYCFTASKGGDCIALAAHILNVPVKDAAVHIAKQFGLFESNNAGTDPETASPFSPLTYLHFEHEAVQALGLEKEAAKALGIGYAKKGIMRGRVAIPIREEDGTIVGYCGYSANADPHLKFPKVIHVAE